MRWMMCVRCACPCVCVCVCVCVNAVALLLCPRLALEVITLAQFRPALGEKGFRGPIVFLLWFRQSHPRGVVVVPSARFPAGAGCVHASLELANTFGYDKARIRRFI